MGLVSQYVEALQAAIGAGADVQVRVWGRSVSVVSVEAGLGWLDVGYVIAESSAEGHALVSLATPFFVVFHDESQDVTQVGWCR